MALSGRKRSWMYWDANFTHCWMAWSEYLSLWCCSYLRARPLRISMVCSSEGSGTLIGWKRRSRALSFSMYLRYSSIVVAPMTWRSPRERAGFMMLPASMAPPPSPVPPAPTMVWISSIMRMIWRLESITSLITFFRRSSNSPRYLVPARSIARSSWMMRLPCRSSGTSPEAIICARPSAMAVLPTPGSPMSTGLFFWRRARIWIVRSSSLARPTSGSMVPSAAIFVRSVPNSSRVPVLPPAPLPLVLTPTSAFSPFSSSSFTISSGILVGSTPSFSRIFTALPPSSLISASRMWAVSMAFEFKRRASSTPSESTRFAAGVKGISTETMPLPRPTISSTVLRVSLRLTPTFLRTFADAPELSATTPTSSISVPT
mmetsp:Transcript_87426/g.189377  ORF Transcript_87426/g.189377 Transcript_87426/m.189377 type:complete len:374 (-) Transcript_87426:640-1761(-)